MASGETVFTTANLWMAALAEHRRTWVGPNNNDEDRKDFRLYQRMKDLKDSKDNSVIRDILAEYRVARNFGLGPTEKNKKMRDSHPLLKEWLLDADHLKGNLLERSEAIRIKAEYLAQNNYSRGRPVSGLSKLAWFAAPKGWAMFDRLASTGLLHGKKTTNGKVEGKSRFAQFYQTLEDLEFQKACETLRPFLEERCNDKLWPERVFDKALMILGRRENYRLLRENAPDVANPEFEVTLKLGQDMDKLLKDEELTKHLKIKWGLQ